MRLTDLPRIEFFDTDKEHVQQTVFNIYTKITGRTLAQGDPVSLFLKVISEIIIRLLNDANYAAKQNLLAYAEGDNLDHVGAVPAAVDRLQATKAVTTMKATLSAVRTKEVLVPKGTRISTDAGAYFATVEDLVIPAGSLTGTVSAQAEKVGTDNNGLQPGEINVVIDPVAYVNTIVNTTVSEGGADREDDESYRERIHEAPESFSVAGPTGAYEYFTKSASHLVVDVGVSSPQPGYVNIYPLLAGGAIPGEELLKTITNYLSDRKRRPLTDKLTVLAPTTTRYNIDAKYYTDTGADVTAVKAKVDAAVDNYVVWQKSKIGRDIVPSRLVQMVMEVPGVKRVDVTTPVFTPIAEQSGVAVANTVSVVLAGSEEE